MNNYLQRTLAALALLSVSVAAFAAPILAIDPLSYQLVSSRQVDRTIFEYSYTAEIVNTGTAAVNVSASVTSTAAVTTIIEGVANFGSVPAGARVRSSDTFTIRHDRRVAFNPGVLVWNIAFQSAPNVAPVANAGADQVVFEGQIVTLNGTASTDADGNPLTYRWTLATRPAGSVAVLTNSNAATTSFEADLPGLYEARLVVNDGVVDSAPDLVSIQTNQANVAPVASAGLDRGVLLGTTVQLDGTASTDANGDELAFIWMFLSRPPGSNAVLSDESSPVPTFVADAVGEFVVALVVDDGLTSSEPDTVIITTASPNSAPVANAGPDQSIEVGATAALNGSASSDADSDPLQYSWTILSRPAGSGAVLSAGNIAEPTFLADRVGQFIVQLIVNDGEAASEPDTVVINVGPGNSPPTANGGPDQVVTVGDAVTLDGSASSDPDGDPLAFDWSLTTRPAGSTAELNTDNMPVVSVTPDVEGLYIAQLLVNDGIESSAADTVNITAVPPPNDPPVANDDNAVTDQDAPVLVAVLANDSDPDGDTFNLASVTNGGHGTAVIVGLGVRYTPDPGFSGSDSFSYTISDGELTDTASVFVTVNEVSIPVVAADDFATTPEDEPITIAVLANDTGGDSPLQIASVTPTPRGTVTIDGNNLVFVPNVNYNGTTTFSYVATDGATSDPATVTVTVTPVNDAPAAVADAANTGRLLFVDIPVLSNDTDIDGDVLSISSVTQGARGTVSIFGGAVRYVPGSDFTGTDSFSYTMTDGTVTATAGVAVTVVDAYLPEPIAYYRLDGSGAEATGNNVNLNPFGSPGYSSSFGPGLGSALDLDGGEALMATGFTPSTTGNLTISAWVNARTFEQWSSVVKAWGGSGDHFHFGVDVSGRFLENWLRADPNYQHQVLATSPFPLNAWTHVALVIDGPSSTQSLYINGTRVASASYPAPLLGASGPLAIGAKPNPTANGPGQPTGQFWHGLIDDVAIWDQALSGSQLDRIRQAGLNGIAIAPLVGLPSEVDTTPPVITPNIVGTPGGAGWYVSGVDVSWTVTDSQSPITSSSGCDRVYVIEDTAGRTLTCTATSAGGTASQSVTIRKDASPPAISFPKPAPSATYTLGQSVLAQFECADAGSGVGSCAGTLDTGVALDTATLGAHTFEVTGTDQAGNTQTFTRSYHVVAPGAIVISTIAGGGPIDSVNALSAGLGQSAGLYIGGIAVDGRGNSFIAVPSQHQVFKVDSSGFLTLVAGYGSLIYSGDGGAAVNAGLAYPSGLALDGAGNLYIADSGNSRIRRVDAVTRVITTIAGSGVGGLPVDGTPATSANIGEVSGLAVDASGNLYFSERQRNRIYRIDAVTQRITTFAGTGTRAYSGDGGLATAANIGQPMGVAVDAAGNVYVADTDNYRVRRIAADTRIISTVAGSGTFADIGDGGAATSAGVMPWGIALDTSGNLYIADFGHARIRRVDASTGVITSIAGTGSGSDSGDGGLASAAGISSTGGIAADAAGRVYIAARSSGQGHVIRRIEGSPQTISRIAGNGEPSHDGTVVPATSAALSGLGLEGIARDIAGNLYIVDTMASRVRKVDAVSGEMSTVAGTGSPAYSADGGLATAASLNYPRDVTVDNLGNIFVSDTNTGRVRRIDAVSGRISTVAGSGVFGFLGDGGPAVLASFSTGIFALAVDQIGNVYVSDAFNYRIRKIDAATGIITTVAGNGTMGFSGDGGQATAASLGFPRDITLDAVGNLYIADNGNGRVRKVDAVTGVISTIAGNGTSVSSGDGGPANAAGLVAPSGIAVLGGNLYVADGAGYRIRRIDSAGIITTVAGTGVRGLAGDGGSPTAAQLNYLAGITVDPQGALYFVDYGSQRIRRVGPAGGAVDTTPPVITLAVAGSPGNNGWYIDNVGVAWEATDAESPVLSLSGCGPTQVNTDTSGLTLTCTATSAGGSATQSVTIRRDATPPVANLVAPPEGATYEQGSLVAANYNCSDATSGSFACVGTVASGSPIDTATTGARTFTVNATDVAGNTATVTHNYTVTATVPPVLAAPDTATTLEDQTISIFALANDSGGGAPLSISAITQGAHGTAIIFSSFLRYTPAANFNGSDSFTYTATDGTTSSTATVTVTVTPVNDPPVANDDILNTDEDVVGGNPLLANDTDVDGDTLTITAVTQGTLGTAVINGTALVFTPNANVTGSETLTYTVSDGQATDTGTVTININPVNDRPDAVDDTSGTTSGESVLIAVLANDTDVENSTLSVVSLTQPANGTATTNGSTVTYTAPAGFVGTATFTYTASDGQLTDVATVTVSVSSHAPHAVASPDDGDAIDLDILQLIGSGSSDEDNDALTYLWEFVEQPALSNATISNNTVANPTVSNVRPGRYVFRLTVNDGHVSASDLASYNVIDAPAISIDDVSINEGNSGTVNAVFTVSLSRTINRPVTAHFLVGSGTAAVGSDFEALEGNVAFAPNTTTPQTISVVVRGDTQFEPDEIFHVVLSAPTNARIADAQGTGTVRNDDPDPAFAITLTPNPVHIETYSSQQINVQLGSPAAPGGQAVNLSSGSPSVSVSPTAFVPGGSVSGTATVTTTASAGSVIVTGSAAGYTAGGTEILVVNRAANVQLSTSLVGVGRSISGQIVLERPAPAGGIVFNLASASPAFAQPNPAVVTVPAGQSAVAFSVNGVAVGEATVNATAAGYSVAGANVTTTNTVISLGAIPNIGPSQNISLNVSLSQPALTPVVISLSSSDPSIASVTPSVTIAAGATTPGVNPVVTGVGIGSTTINASGAGFAPDSTAVVVTLSLSLNPASVSVAATRTQNVTLQLSSPAPVGGLAVTLSSDNPAIATFTPQAVTVPAGQLIAQVQVQGVAQGSTVVRASAPGVTATSANVTVTPAPRLFFCVNGGCGQQNGATVRIGEDLQVNLRGYLEEAPPSPLTMTATMASTSVAVVSGVETALGGAAASDDNITAISGTAAAAQFWVQGLAQGGSTTVTLSAPGYAPAVLNIVVDPSGVVLYTPTSNFTTNTSAVNTSITVQSVRLNAGTLTYATPQEVRGGLTVSVPVTSSVPTAGVITTSPVLLQAVADGLDDNRVSTSFDPVGGGVTNIVVGVPAGFDTAVLEAGNGVNDRTVIATVNAPQIVMCVNGSCNFRTGATIRVGEDLQVNVRGYLEEAPPAPLTMTATMASTAIAVVSGVETALGGAVASDSNITAISGTTAAAQFWVQGLAQGAATTVTLSAPGYTDAVLNVVVDPSGVVLYTPTSNFTTNTSAANTNITVHSVRLNAGTLTYATSQEVRGGLIVSVPVTSSVPAAGVITTSPVLLQAVADTQDDTRVTTQFDPVGGGVTNIVVEVPAGLDTAVLEAGNGVNDRTVIATVNAPQIVMCVNGSCNFRTGATIRVGEDLQVNVRGYLEEAPPAPLTMTATMASTAVAVVSGVETALGGAVASDSNITAISGTTAAAQFWVQGLAQGGSTTVTLSAPGYADAVLNVVVDPSGAVLYTPVTNFTTNTSAANTNITVHSVRLNAGTLTYAASQEVRGGLVMSVPITSSVPTAGVITTSPLLLQAVADNQDDTRVTTQFDPVGGGVTNIVVEVPAGFDTAVLEAGNGVNDRTLVATVNAPQIIMCLNGSCNFRTGATLRVGEDLQVNVRGYLEAAPSSPVTMTATMASTAVAVVSGVETALGGAVASDSNITAISGTTAAAQFWVQGLVQGGSTTVTLSAPGYADAVLNLVVDPSGVVLYTPTSNFTTNTSAANMNITVHSVRLNAGTLTYAASQEVRGGLTVSVPVTSSVPTVGVITASPLLLQAVADTQDDTRVTTQFDPVGGGVTNIVVEVPAGFDTAVLEAGNGVNDRTLIATVNAPAIIMCLNGACNQQSGATALIGEDLQINLRAYLQEAPAAPVTLTATSTGGGIAVISTSEISVGGVSRSATGVTATSSGAASAAQFWVQALARGNTTITLSAPGYATATLNVQVDPSGFILSNNDFSTTSSASNTTVIVHAARLDPLTLRGMTLQELRGGITATVQVTSSIPGVGVITTSPVFVQAVADGDQSEAARTQFDPLAAGTTQIEAVPPVGFDATALGGSYDRFVIVTVN